MAGSAVTSCDIDQTQGIYYTIEKETLIIDNSLPNELSITDIQKYNGYYYAVAGPIFRRQIRSEGWDNIADWNKIKQPSDALCIDFIILQNGFLALYGGSSSQSLYYAADENFNWKKVSVHNSASETLPQSLDGEFYLKKISYLLNGSEYIYLSYYSEASNEAKIFRGSIPLDTSGDTPILSSQVLSNPTEGLFSYFRTVMDSDNQIWAISGNRVYTSPASDGLSFTEYENTSDKNAPLATTNFNDIKFRPGVTLDNGSTADILLISSDKGIIYCRDYTRDLWLKNETDLSIPISCAEIYTLTLADQSTEDHLIIGTMGKTSNGNGYYETVIPASTTEFKLYNPSSESSEISQAALVDNYTSTELRTSIFALFTDSIAIDSQSKNILFAGTAGQGLFRLEDSEWNWE